MTTARAGGRRAAQTRATTRLSAWMPGTLLRPTIARERTRPRTRVLRARLRERRAQAPAARSPRPRSADPAPMRPERRFRPGRCGRREQRDGQCSSPTPGPATNSRTPTMASSCRRLRASAVDPTTVGSALSAPRDRRIVPSVRCRPDGDRERRSSQPSADVIAVSRSSQPPSPENPRADGQPARDRRVSRRVRARAMPCTAPGPRPRRGARRRRPQRGAARASPGSAPTTAIASRRPYAVEL